ncbi:hypothetical protein CMUS01_01529 [Colletotrichum musicola]|uniref:Clr5 domain-containing protein n=1 Tax=Colletotrichum musicola TaxID=2175873 RepID=A0A8H6NWQ8_9PEZI|nr:hypothetical protein CMUS01_01529 [Colletotrichum musicola]
MKASTAAVPMKRKASTDSEADEMTSPGQSSKPRKRVPAEIWETKRPIITRLYQEEKRSLKEVMEIMERDYHFVATVKMYKSRIWKWGLDKKLKGDEVLAIMILKRDRDALKRPTEFRIRGQPVDLENINRYLKRNPSLMAKFRAGHTPSTQTTLEVTCRTPSPPPSPARALAPPTELQSSEQILCLFRDYVDGSFSSGAWSCEYNVECFNSRLAHRDRSDDLFNRVIASFALVNRCLITGDQIRISNILDPAFEFLKQLVAAESPNFVARTVCLLWYLERHHKPGLLGLVVDYLAGLIPIVLGPHHILAHIWRRLGSTRFSDYSELSIRLYSMLLPEIESRAGPANYLTHLLASDYLDCVFERWDLEDCEAMFSGCRARAEASGQEHTWLGDMALTHVGLLALCKENQGRPDEAVEVLTAHMNAYSMTDEEEASLNLELGVKYYRMGNISAAITSFKSAARIALTSGVDERTSLTALTNLERMFRETGRTSRADCVQQYRMQRLDEFAVGSASMSRGFSNDDDDSEGEEIELESLPEWLWRCDDDEDENPAWLELPPFAWGTKCSPGSFGGCANNILDWQAASQGQSPAVLSTEYSPRNENPIVDPEVEYMFGQQGGIR